MYNARSVRDATLAKSREFVSFAVWRNRVGGSIGERETTALHRNLSSLWGAVFAAAVLTSASCQVIAVDEGGVSHTYCTSAQNDPGTPPGGEKLAVPAQYRASLERASQRFQISVDLLDTVARRESNYNPRAVSPKGAIGLMQLMPATAKAFGVNPFDIDENIRGGAAYLRYLLDVYQGRIDLALSAYNAGQTAIARYGGVPPFKETRIYLLRSLENLAQKSDLGSSGATGNLESGYIQICR